jgi:hypothetical protein
MIQTILVFGIVAAALIYTGYKIYAVLTKKDGCKGCKGCSKGK